MFRNLPAIALLVCSVSITSARSGAAPNESPSPFSREGEIRAWIADRQYDKALPLLRAAVRETKDPDLAYALLYCLYEERSYVRILSLGRRNPYRSALSQPRGWTLGGLAQWRLGRTPQALAAWMRVVAAHPHDDRAWQCIRVALLSADRRERTGIARQILGNPSIPPFGAALIKGTLAQQRGLFEEAEKQLATACQEDPDSRTAVEALLYLYRTTGDRERAAPLERWLEKPDRTRSDETILNQKPIDDNDTYSPGERGAEPAYRLPWPAGQAVFCGSHRGRLETPHRGRGRHALDFMIPASTAVLAARAGRVIAAQDSQAAQDRHEFGTWILIDHGDGTFGRYFHLRGGSVRVRPGEMVAQGQVLGGPGRSGRCQCRQVHFEVIRKAPLGISQPQIYTRWETLPVDFVETQGLAPASIPGQWLTSRNSPSQR